MGFVDGLLIAAVVGGAVWLLYRSLIKHKGACPGCSGCSCGKDRTKEHDRLSRFS